MSVVDSAVERVADSPVVSRGDLPLLLVLPGLFVFLAFMLFPVLYLVYLSFTNAEPATLFQGREQWVGLANYVRVLSDGQFWNSMGVTWLFVATSVALKVLVGLGVGLVVTGKRVRGKRFMRALIIVPLGLPGIFTITIWRGIFSSAEFGLANQFLRMAGLGSVAWLSERWMAFLAYNVTEAWLAYPFMVIITVSALQDVSEELHEAAMIDGAGFFARFLHVTLPSIKRPVLFASILTAAASFQQFLIPYVFNQGGPSRTNELLIVYGYREAFRFQKYGEGAAIMLVAVAVIGVFMMLNVKKGQLADGVDDA
ncbi:carbohydrate ABC transporter permease [Haloferax denitrificans]|uniref:Putative maltose ABC transporter permease n=1 Tax=Haloferax denitrificans ATCC 35960 TaxID=662478 RepID=M0J1S4_9EURY|nr:sugar ABC transporter permease [Haloferax denitrificans]EMA01675.1 putative maltose ABC transporter permease [Haloferax denitrificans ATCC 35960]